MKKLLILFAITIMLIPIGVVSAQYYNIDGYSEFNENVELIKDGNFSFSYRDIVKKVCSIFTYEISEIKTILLSLFGISIISGCFGGIGLSDKKVFDTAFFSCFCLMSVAVTKIISLSVGYATDVINAMNEFVTQIAPMLSVLLISCGYAVSAASFYSVFSVSVWVIGEITKHCILPLVYIGCITGIINNFSETPRIESFNKLVKSASKWVVAGILTVFTAINAIYGLGTPSVDGVGMKAAKFAIGTMVPVVGGFLSDSIETVIATSSVIKNAVGTAGIITLLSMCLVPVVKISAIVIMLKLFTSLIEPMCDKRFINLIGEATDASSSMLALVIVVSLLFILSIAILISSTNLS